MSLGSWGVAESAKAKQIWALYQQQHDLSDRLGQTVGIDPVSGRLWFGGRYAILSYKETLKV